MTSGELLPIVQTIMLGAFALFAVVWMIRMGNGLAALRAELRGVLERLANNDPAALRAEIRAVDARVSQLYDELAVDPIRFTRAGR